MAGVSAVGAVACPACEGLSDIVVIHVQRALLRHVVDMFNRAGMHDEGGARVSIAVQSPREWDYPNHVDLITTREWPE